MAPPDAERCAAKTGKGERCPFRNKDGKEWCGIHAKVKNVTRYKEAKMVDVQDEPKAVVGPLQLPPKKVASNTIVIPAQNNKKIVKKIQAKMKRGPTLKDAKGGAIYVYRMAREKGMDYWKVGMTDRTADARMDEWERTHKDRIVRVDRYILSRNHVMAELLIHWCLDYCRMYRYPSYTDDGTFFKSVWKNSGALIDDGQMAKIKQRPVAKNKHIEWFHCEKARLDQVVQSVIQYCHSR